MTEEEAKRRADRDKEEIVSQLHDDLERVKSDKDGEDASTVAAGTVEPNSQKASSLDDFSPSETLVWGKDGRLESDPAGYAHPPAKNGAYEAAKAGR